MFITRRLSRGTGCGGDRTWLLVGRRGGPDRPVLGSSSGPIRVEGPAWRPSSAEPQIVIDKSVSLPYGDMRHHWTGDQGPRPAPTGGDHEEGLVHDAGTGTGEGTRPAPGPQTAG